MILLSLLWSLKLSQKQIVIKYLREYKLTLLLITEEWFQCMVVLEIS